MFSMSQVRSKLPPSPEFEIPPLPPTQISIPKVPMVRTCWRPGVHVIRRQDDLSLRGPSSRTPGAPCHQSITSHFVCLWPGALSDDEIGSYFDATEKPWSDREAPNIVFGNVPAFYFGGGRLERKGDSLLDRATV